MIYSLNFLALPGGGMRVVAESNPLITWLVPLATSPHPEAIQGPTKEQKTLSNHPGNSKEYRNSGILLAPLSLRKLQGF